jgi:hypothetical protein
MIVSVNRDFFLNSVNQFIFVMVKRGVLFEVRTEFLNSILTSTEGPATGHLDTDFLGFPLSLSKC